VPVAPVPTPPKPPWSAAASTAAPPASPAAPSASRAAAHDLLLRTGVALADGAYNFTPEQRALLTPVELGVLDAGQMLPSVFRSILCRLTAASALPVALPGADPPGGPAPAQPPPRAGCFEGLMHACPYPWISRSEFDRRGRLPPRGPDGHPCLDVDAVLKAHEPYCKQQCALYPDRPCEGATFASIIHGWNVTDQARLPGDLDSAPRREAAYQLDPALQPAFEAGMAKAAASGYIVKGEPLVDSPGMLAARRVMPATSAVPSVESARSDAVPAAARLKAVIAAKRRGRGLFEAAAYEGVCDLKFRLVANCSAALNDWVFDWPFYYEGARPILAAMSKGCLLLTRDVKGAYIHMRLGAESRKYVGFHDRAGVGWVYDGAVMGVKSVCAAFSAVSAFVVMLCNNRGLPPGVIIVPYIDDFTFIAPDAASMAAAVACFDAVCKEIGLFIDPADPKNQGVPATSCVALGLLFDSIAMTVGLPADKLYLRAFDTFLLAECIEQRIPVPRDFFESFAGKMAHLASVYPQAAQHARQLYPAVSLVDSKGRPLSHLHLWADHSRLDTARVGIAGLAEMFSKGALSAQRALTVSPRPIVTLASDASGSDGWGCRVGRKAFWGQWSAAQGPRSIGYKELWALYCMVDQFAPETAADSWAGRVVHVTTDNLSNVYNINKLVAGGDQAQLMAAISEACCKNNIILVASWLPREYNVFCDALSKCTLAADAHAICRGLDFHDLSGYAGPGSV
jgi:hypothetical protein